MLAMNDPVARELAARFDPVRMPNLRLSEQDADDLISFLHRENAKLVEAPAPARQRGDGSALGHPSRPCRKRVYARLRRAVAGHLGMRPSQGSALRYPFFGDQR
jgi:hypothetical protein